MSCVIHYDQIDLSETLFDLTDDRIKQIRKCADLWSTIYKEPERSMADSFNFIYSEPESLSTHHQYHKQCYLRFASDTKIEKALQSSKHRNPPKVCFLPSIIIS